MHLAYLLDTVHKTKHSIFGARLDQQSEALEHFSDYFDCRIHKSNQKLSWGIAVSILYFSKVPEKYNSFFRIYKSN